MRFAIKSVLFLLLGVCVTKVITENARTSYYYNDKVSIKCVIADKIVRYYNATPQSRSVDLRTKNVCVCNHDGAYFEVNVSDRTYYNVHPGDTVYFNITLYDVYGDPNGLTDELVLWLLGGVLAVILLFVMFAKY